MASGKAVKSDGAFRTISEAAEELGVKQHVLRFWEGKFPQIKPMKRGGGRRYYRPEDVEVLKTIRDLLYDRGFTIKGAQQHLKDGGGKAAPPAASGEEGPAVPKAQLEALLADLTAMRDQLRGVL